MNVISKVSLLFLSGLMMGVSFSIPQLDKDVSKPCIITIVNNLYHQSLRAKPLELNNRQLSNSHNYLSNLSSHSAVC